MRKMEKLQKRALRYVYKDFNSCYTALLDRAAINTLYVKRLRSMLSLVCNTINNEGSMYLNNAFVLNENSYSRKYLLLIQPKFNTQKYGFKSIRYQGSRLWNNVDNEHRNSNKLKEWEPNCTCATCDVCILKEV